MSQKFLTCSSFSMHRRRLEKYDQACSVDGSTQSCAGPPEACRRAMLDILGTELRTNCGCEGTTADFRELYDCIGWHRLLWVNPCVGKIFRWNQSKTKILLFQWRYDLPEINSISRNQMVWKLAKSYTFWGTKAELLNAFSTCVYCMCLHFQSN